MNSKAIIITLIIATIMLLAGVSIITTVGGSDIEDGSRDSRATSIDGEFYDQFNNADNLTMKGGAGVFEGEVIVDRAAIRDEFDRFPLAPWQAVEGNPRIVQGVLLTNATGSAAAIASINFDMHDVEVRMDLSPGFMGMGGPRIALSGPGPDTIWGIYDDGAGEVRLMLTNSTGNYTLASSNAQLATNDWYRARFLIDGDDIVFELGPVFLMATNATQGNFSTLSIGSLPMASAAWDNVTVSRLGGTGTALTAQINLPVDTFWTTLKLVISKPVGTDLEISLVNPSTGGAYMGLDDITSTFIDLEDRLDPMTDTSVQLKIYMTADGTNTPRISSWKVSWEGDPPTFVKPIPSTTLEEDEGRTGVMDLRQYFDDRFTDDDNLIFSIAWVSESLHVLPVVDGNWLGFELPAKDWYGVEYYKIRCSDGVLFVDSLQATVVVNPIDDEPIVRPFNRIDMYEDEQYIFNITPYLEDVDTPVENLRVRAMSDHATVQGQNILLNYDAGGSDRVELVISDYNNEITYFMDVTIRDVNDPPVFLPFDQIAIYEDTVRTVDLSEFVSDEDDELEDLLFDIGDDDRYITLDGLIITLLYNDTGGEFEYYVIVSDEYSTVQQVLKVSVQPVNDVPTIVSVGGIEPVDGKVSWTMTEGNTTDLVIEVVDEESKGFQYTLVTDLDGAIMVGKTLRLVTAVGEIGSYSLQISVSDGKAAALVRIGVEVTNRNDPVQDAAISEPTNGTKVEVGTLLTLRGYAFDPDFAFNQQLTFTWRSDLDGNLGVGKILEVNLTQGDHTITMNVTDGEFTAEAIVTVRVLKEGSGGGGGGGGDNGGSDDPIGISPFIIIGIIVALVAVGAVFIIARAKGMANPNYVEFSEPPEDEEPIPSAAEAYDKPKAGASSGKGPAKPIDEAAALYGADLKAKEAKDAGKTTPGDAAPAPKPVETVAPVAAPKLQSIARDTASLAGDDPEQLRLDKSKREYQAAISALPWGVPSSELAGMDWYELAAAMANGEQKDLPDGRKVVKIDDKWYYADVEDPKNLLRRHE